MLLFNIMAITKRSFLVSGAALLIGCSFVAFDQIPRQLAEKKQEISWPENGNTSEDVELSDFISTYKNSSRKAELGQANSKSSSVGAAGSYLAARIASQNGNHEKAAYYLGKVLASTPENKDIIALAIRHNLLAGHTERALELAVTSGQAGDDRYIGLLTFVAALHHGNMEEARAKVTALKPVGLHALFVPFLQSWMQYSTSSQAQRVNVADSLGHGYFQSLQHYHQALQYQLSGDVSMAQASYETALSSINSTPESVIMAAVQFYMKQQKPERAKAIIRAYREVRSRNALWNLGTDEEYAQRLSEMNAVVVKDVTGGIAELFSNIGTLLVLEGAHDEGQALLRISLHLRPDDQLTLLTLANSLEEKEQYTQAVSVYRAMKAPAWMQEVVTMYIARTYHAMGEVEKARDMLTSLYPTAKARYNLAVMLGDLERVEKHHEQAADYYSDAINAIGELSRADWPLVYRRGIMHDLSGKWQEAELDFKKALELEPDEPQILNYLGYSWLLRNERFQEAADMLQKAVEASPNDAHIIDSYGWALYKLGEYDKALEQLEQALMMIPSDPTVNDHYGDILWQLGRKTEARYHWQRALLFSPTEPGAKEAIEAKLKHGLQTAEDKKSYSTRHSDASQ